MAPGRGRGARTRGPRRGGGPGSELSRWPRRSRRSSRIGVSGAASMAYEIAWTRALASRSAARPTPSRRCSRPSSSASRPGRRSSRGWMRDRRPVSSPSAASRSPSRSAPLALLPAPRAAPRRGPPRPPPDRRRPSGACSAPSSRLSFAVMIVPDAAHRRRPSRSRWRRSTGRLGPHRPRRGRDLRREHGRDHRGLDRARASCSSGPSASRTPSSPRPRPTSRSGSALLLAAPDAGRRGPAGRRRRSARPSWRSAPSCPTGIRGLMTTGRRRLRARRS